MTARSELGKLEAGGLIEIAALEPELEYLFKHALVQEAAYASLLKQDRRTLHRAAAEAIIALHPDRERENAAVIGMHFEKAGDAAAAARYFLVAGDHALERFASKEAAAHYRQANGLAQDDQPKLKLESAIGAAKAGWTFNEPGGDIDRLERAIAACDGDERLEAEAYFWVAFLRRQRGETPESSPGLRAALDRAAEMGSSPAESAAAALPRAFLGSYTAFTGHLRQGAREMSEALDTLESHGDPVSGAMIADFLGMTYARLGEFVAAEGAIERSQRLAEQGDDIARLDAMIAAAALDLERGEPGKAFESALQCATRSEELGAYACFIASNVMYGSACLALDDAPAAKTPLERSDELCRVTNMASMRTLIQGLLASTRAQMGDLPGGVAGWNQALDAARAMHDRFGEAQTLWGRARSYMRQTPADWSAALADLDLAVGLFQEMETAPALARSLHDRAKALHALGREADADGEDRRSREIGRGLELRDVPFV